MNNFQASICAFVTIMVITIVSALIHIKVTDMLIIWIAYRTMYDVAKHFGKKGD